METPEQLTITDAAKRFNVSRATLLRRVKTGKLKRNDDGMFDIQDLLDAGFVQRDSDVSDAPHDTPDAPQDVAWDMSQVETLKGVIDTLQKQLETSQDEKAQLLRQLDQAQALLLNEQQTIKELLTSEQAAKQPNTEQEVNRPGIVERIGKWWIGK